ncbi:bifunctional 2-keto-4-hydroxyglutarate aldolase/2-keto-3-deoxy-6-phosphogluconate aldolase [Clostridium ljungdahlii]|uniref:2-dehydro-3-deoxy-6-phosphogalactonate aldolase n=1 Tax=Clostridium ljungdahlii (strain ATCC 55383 / DSM 13528 / PETC) TaxID=748727 RepID=D8GS76_CLOLD|nr:bifunctional 2-keto-4-hydroxyglutarate aldolase/2-keto-3-deoxy-6-phosphogluconate aldolase [Clostridium ljungdahlii]ADK14429.1 putative KDPG and KHG aldolase [Clostridium ljungdahlii DSM 13528]OAA88151.1 2-dehydro-3-deoxy-6-phosphogalactonate aldolase [Clostridium ljungdahlii DSM 13528]
MWKKLENLKKIEETGILLMIRLDSEDEAMKVAEAAIKGGILALEITMSVPNALGIVKKLSEKYKEKGLVIGVGTVLDPETARAAILAGANMLVSPNLNPEMIKMGKRYQTVIISGAFTPTEIVNTLEEGADIVKLFPTEFIGPAYVKTVKGPLDQAAIMPSGGVTLENAGEWLQAGATCLGVGSGITKAAQKDGDYTKVTKAAELFLKVVKESR